MSSIIVEEWRDLWSFKVDFVLVSIAWVFANGNFLNLPHIIAEEGGVVFVIAYVACILIVCLPLLIMELAVGQLTGRAPIQAMFNICPLFKGVGVAHILISLAFASFIAVMLSHVLLFAFYVIWNLFEGTQPSWLHCDNYWNTDMCARVAISNGTSLPNLIEGKSSIQEFIERQLIVPSENIETPGLQDDPIPFVWKLTASLGVVWLLVFLAIFAGVRWLGKACYFTFTIPLILLVALLIRAVTLGGTMDLLYAMFTTDGNIQWNLFLTHKLWTAAFTRSLISVGFGFGAFITLGSYNKRSNNLVSDGFLILLFHLLTTILQLFTVIGMMGYLAKEFALTEPQELLLKTKGFGLLYMFMVGLYRGVPMSAIWIIILLFMVTFVLLNSLYVLSFNLLSAAEDGLGEGASRFFPRFGLALAVCLLGYAVGLGNTTHAGTWGIALMDHFLSHVTIWVILACEIFAVGWFYCAHLLGRDIRQMVYRCCCWVTGWINMYLVYLLPAVPIYILVMNMMKYNFQENLRAREITDCEWAEPLGWCVAVLPILPIPFFMIYIMIKTCIRGPGLTYRQRLKYTVISPLRYEVIKPSPPPRYTASAPGYVLLPQAPLAEPETYNDMYMERVVKVSNI